MNGRSLLKYQVTIDCCILLLTCCQKVFHDGSAKFASGDFDYVVCLKKFTLKKNIICVTC